MLAGYAPGHVARRLGRRRGEPIKSSDLTRGNGGVKIGMPDALQGWRSPALALALFLIALRRRVCRISRIAAQRHPIAFSACTLALWRWLWDRYRLIATDGPPLPTLPAPEITGAAPPPERCTNSFTITNERGESRGSLNEQATGGWSWQVDESSVTASMGPRSPLGPSLRRDSGEAQAPALAQARHPSLTLILTLTLTLTLIPTRTLTLTPTLSLTLSRPRSWFARGISWRHGSASCASSGGACGPRTCRPSSAPVPSSEASSSRRRRLGLGL